MGSEAHPCTGQANSAGSAGGTVDIDMRTGTCAAQHDMLGMPTPIPSATAYESSVCFVIVHTAGGCSDGSVV